MPQVEIPENVNWFVGIVLGLAALAKTYFHFRKDKRADHTGEQIQVAEDLRDSTYRSLIETCNKKIGELETALNEERRARQIDILEFRREVRQANAARDEAEEQARRAHDRARIAQNDATDIRIEFEKLSLEFIGFKERAIHPPELKA